MSEGIIVDHTDYLVIDEFINDGGIDATAIPFTDAPDWEQSLGTSWKVLSNAALAGASTTSNAVASLILPGAKSFKFDLKLANNATVRFSFRKSDNNADNNVSGFDAYEFSLKNISTKLQVQLKSKLDGVGTEVADTDGNSALTNHPGLINPTTRQSIVIQDLGDRVILWAGGVAVEWPISLYAAQNAVGFATTSATNEIYDFRAW